MNSRNDSDCSRSRRDVPQELDILQLVQPLGVVHERRVGGPVAVGNVVGEDASDPLGIRVDLLDRQDLPHLVLAGRITHFRCPAPHQRDRPVPGLLHPSEQHDLHKVADVQRGRRQVEPDISGDRFLVEPLVQPLQIRAVSQEATVDDRGDELGFRVVGHGFSSMFGRVL